MRCRNGPGTYTLGEHELAHPFDGHGFILSVAIKNGKAFARTRFVETPEYASPSRQFVMRCCFNAEKQVVQVCCCMSHEKQALHHVCAYIIQHVCTIQK